MDQTQTSTLPETPIELVKPATSTKEKPNMNAKMDIEEQSLSEEIDIKDIIANYKEMT